MGIGTYAFRRFLSLCLWPYAQRALIQSAWEHKIRIMSTVRDWVLGAELLSRPVNICQARHADKDCSITDVMGTNNLMEKYLR